MILIEPRLLLFKFANIIIVVSKKHCYWRQPYHIVVHINNPFLALPARCSEGGGLKLNLYQFVCNHQGAFTTKILCIPVMRCRCSGGNEL